MANVFDEYEANLDAVVKAFPDNRLLTMKQMAEYLGLKSYGGLKSFGITKKLTRETFAMRIARKEGD